MNLDKLFELNPEAITWDGLNEAIVGMASKTLEGPIIVTYVDDNDEYQTYEIKDIDETYDRWGRMEFGPIVAYEADKIIGSLMESMGVDDVKLHEGDSEESEKYLNALEYFEYNIDGAYVGDFTPLHIPMFEEDYEE